MKKEINDISDLYVCISNATNVGDKSNHKFSVITNFLSIDQFSLGIVNNEENVNVLLVEKDNIHKEIIFTSSSDFINGGYYVYPVSIPCQYPENPNKFVEDVFASIDSFRNHCISSE